MTLNEQSYVTFVQLILHFHHPKRNPEPISSNYHSVSFSIRRLGGFQKDDTNITTFLPKLGNFFKGSISGFQYMYY